MTRRSPIGAPVLTVKAHRGVETIATVVSTKTTSEDWHFISRDEVWKCVPDVDIRIQPVVLVQE